MGLWEKLKVGGGGDSYFCVTFLWPSFLNLLKGVHSLVPHLSASMDDINNVCWKKLTLKQENHFFDKLPDSKMMILHLHEQKVGGVSVSRTVVGVAVRRLTSKPILDESIFLVGQVRQHRIAVPVERKQTDGLVLKQIKSPVQIKSN